MKEYIAKLQQHTKHLKVLYVEDDPIIQEQTESFLKRFFKQIDLAKNGREGIEKYNTHDYDLVITDINMPEMDGIEMIRQIRKENEEQVILVTSAYNESDYFISLIDLGVDKFVMKPFDNMKFINILGRLTKLIYANRKEAQREVEMQKHLGELEQIISIIEEPLVLIENGMIVQANQAFWEFMQADPEGETRLSSFRIPSMMIEKPGMFYAKTNQELVAKLKKEHHTKAMFKIGDTQRIFLLKLKEIKKHSEEPPFVSGVEDKPSDTVESLGYFILSMVDVHELESQLETDAMTNLPNRNFVMKNIGERIKEEQPFRVVLFSIQNIHQIIKWHGKKATLDIDAQIGRAINDDLKNMPGHLRPVAGYFGRNKYLFIVDPNNKNSAIEEVEKLGELVHRSEAISGKEKEVMQYKFKHITANPEGHSLEEVIRGIELGFDRLAMYAN